MKKKTKAILVSMILIICMILTGCEGFKSGMQDIKGDIVGASYTGEFYSNNGEKFMTVHGEKINMSGNVVKEYTSGETRIRALDDASFLVNKGELAIILGSSPKRSIISALVP